MPVISIEGSIGSGKSTFLQKLKDHGYVVMFEPVDEWTVKLLNNKSMLEMYYEDKIKYGFMFQMYILKSRLENLLEVYNNNPNAVIIIERCPLTDKNIFAEMMYENGILSDYEFYVYKTWYDFVLSTIPKIDGIVYLNTSPGVCIQRIIKRNRDGESLIDINYIHSLHEKHERWLNDDSNSIPILKIDGNGTIPDVTVVDEFVKEVINIR